MQGDIAIFWIQTDTPDSFAFTTFVDLTAGTEIIFTDCVALPAGSFDPLGSGEGAIVYTTPIGGLDIEEVVIFNDTNQAPEFSDYTGDAIIEGTFGPNLSASGDQITALQGTGVSPTVIFSINSASTLFTGDDAASTNQTGLFTGLTDIGLPRTAIAVGAGEKSSSEIDNAIYQGTYAFATIQDAKIALTNPANYIGINTITADKYPTAVATIPTKISIASLSIEDFTLVNSVFLIPNPSKGYVTIKNSGVALDKVVITDISGRTISSYKLNGITEDKELNLNGLVSYGMYLVAIYSGDNTTVKKLLIK